MTLVPILCLYFFYAQSLAWKVVSEYLHLKVMESTLYNIADPHFGGPPPARNSVRNIFPLCVGLVVGFASFGIFFGFQMKNIDDHVFIRHNETLQILKDMLLTTMKEKEACLDNHDTMALKASSLQDLLAGHEALANNYDTLLQEFESTRKMLNTVQEEKRTQEEAFMEQSGIITSLSTEKDDITQELSQLREEETRLLEENQVLMRQIDEADALTSELRMQADETESILDAVELRMQRRENFLCIDEYGDGPYYVQVSPTEGGSDDPEWSFIIELATRHEMPHAVFAFLSLVRYGMLDGTAVEPTENDALNLVRLDADESFEAQLEAVGMANNVLMFLESSEMFPCEEGSVKFDDFGPRLVVHLSAVAETGCFGKIVKGMEHARAIQESLTSGNSVDTLTFRYLRV